MIHYTSGFFDAEGSIWLGASGSGGTVLRAQFAQKDPTILHAIKKYFDITSNITCGKLVVNTRQAENLIEQMEPLLIVKRYEAKLSLSLYRCRYENRPEVMSLKWRERDRDVKSEYTERTEAEWDQYFAGFLDGDGYISSDQSTGRFHVGLSQKSSIPLCVAKRLYGGQIHQRKDGVHQWRVWTLQARTFLSRVAPYLRSPRFSCSTKP